MSIYAQPSNYNKFAFGTHIQTIYGGQTPLFFTLGISKQTYLQYKHDISFFGFLHNLLYSTYLLEKSKQYNVGCHLNFKITINKQLLIVSMNANLPSCIRIL